MPLVRPTTWIHGSELRAVTSSFLKEHKSLTWKILALIRTSQLVCSSQPAHAHLTLTVKDSSQVFFHAYDRLLNVQKVLRVSQNVKSVVFLQSSVTNLPEDILKIKTTSIQILDVQQMPCPQNRQTWLKHSVVNQSVLSKSMHKDIQASSEHQIIRPTFEFEHFSLCLVEKQKLSPAAFVYK